MAVPCAPCRQYRNSPVYFIGGEPVYHEHCLIGRQGCPTVGVHCAAFDPLAAGEDEEVEDGD